MGDGFPASYVPLTTQQMPINERTRSPFDRSYSTVESLGAAFDDAMMDTPEVAYFGTSAALESFTEEGQRHGWEPKWRPYGRNRTQAERFKVRYPENVEKRADYVDNIEALELIEQGGVKGQIKLPEHSPYFSRGRLQFMIEMKQEENILRRRIAAGSQTAWGAVGTFGMGMLGGMSSPINLASSYIPIGTAARAATSVARSSSVLQRGMISTAWRESKNLTRMAGMSKAAKFRARFSQNAVDGMVTAAPLEMIVLDAAEDLQRDYTTADMMANILVGGVLGGGISAGSGALSDALRAMRIARKGTDLEGTATPQAAAEFTKPQGRMGDAVDSLDRQGQQHVLEHQLNRDLAGYKADPDMLMRQGGVDPQAPRLPAKRLEDGRLRIGQKKFVSDDHFFESMDEWAQNPGVFRDDIRSSGLTSKQIERIVAAEGTSAKQAALRDVLKRSQDLDMKDLGAIRDLTGEPTPTPRTLGDLARTEKMALDELSISSMTDAKARDLIAKAKKDGYFNADQKITPDAMRRMLENEQAFGLRVFKQKDQARMDKALEQFEGERVNMASRAVDGPMQTGTDSARWAEGQNVAENLQSYDATQQNTLKASREIEAERGDADATRAQQENTDMLAALEDVGEDLTSTRRAFAEQGKNNTLSAKALKLLTDCELGSG